MIDPRIIAWLNALDGESIYQAVCSLLVAREDLRLRLACVRCAARVLASAQDSVFLRARFREIDALARGPATIADHPFGAHLLPVQATDWVADHLNAMMAGHR